MGAFGGAMGGTVSTTGNGVRHFSGDGGASARPGRGPQAHPIRANRPQDIEPVPNLVLIGSPNQEAALRTVHVRLLETNPGVQACSRLVDLSTYSSASYWRFLDGPHPETPDATDYALNRFILDAAETAKAALVVNIEPDADNVNAEPLPGGIRFQEFEELIVPIGEMNVPVFYMQQIPEDSGYAFHTMSTSIGLPPQNVVGACWAAIASLAVHDLN